MLRASGSERQMGSLQRHTWSTHSWALAPYCGQQRQSVREATLGSRAASRQSHQVRGGIGGREGQSLQRWRRGSREM